MHRYDADALSQAPANRFCAALSSFAPFIGFRADINAGN
jgi:hypothetical protein